jgi:hypothetical protein
MVTNVHQLSLEVKGKVKYYFREEGEVKLVPEVQLLRANLMLQYSKCQE